MRLSRYETWSGSPRWLAIRVTALLIFSAALFTSGCSESSNNSGYDPSLRYGFREDPLVVRLPEVNPTNYPPTGQLDEHLLKFPELRGEIWPTKQLSGDQRQELLAALEAEFGIPAAPKLPAALPYTAQELQHGSRVYSRICRNCHGLNGDGRGPAGPWMVPPPRDFRAGVFELAMGRAKPKFEELVSLIKHGVPGSNMQAFDLIPDNDLQAAAVYTIHLSIRGEVETRLLTQLLDPTGESVPESIPEEVRTSSERIAQQWLEASQLRWPEITLPTDPAQPEHAASVRRGHELFRSSAVGCMSCHEDYGRKETYRYNLWGQVTRVANLTRGEFRWGRSPERIAGRIRHGIPAVNMPAHPALSDDQLRDLTLFLKELSLPDRLPVDVREAIYPEGS